MAMVRFATTCDISTPAHACPDGPECLSVRTRCGARSEEYSSWPSCRYCGDDCCPEHRRPNSERGPDVDFAGDCVCVECHPEDRAQLVEGETWEDFHPREQDDDDGLQYADPRDEMEERLR